MEKANLLQWLGAVQCRKKRRIKAKALSESKQHDENNLHVSDACHTYFHNIRMLLPYMSARGHCKKALSRKMVQNGSLLNKLLTKREC